MSRGPAQSEWRSFIEARRCDETDAAATNMGSGYRGEGFKLSEPTGEDRSNAVEGQLGVNAGGGARVAGGEMFFGIQAQAAF